MRYRPKGSAPDDDRLGRFLPDDWKHVEKYPLSAILDVTVATVEKVMVLPSWHWTHDQGTEGSCVGHGSVMERAITNTAQRKTRDQKPFNRRYDPIDLWERAKSADEWPETNPGDQNGTSVRAAYDVLRRIGPRPIKTTGIRISDSTGLPEITDTSHVTDVQEGVSTTRWATTVDELRSGVSAGIPVVLGINWYEGLDRLTDRSAYSHLRATKNDVWTGVGDLGRLRGGHCVCVYGASDERQAFRLKNSWGRTYPPVWLSYEMVRRLLIEDGEAALATDR